LIRDTALKSANSHTGKGITPKEIDDYLDKEKQKEQEVIQVRLENIKLKNQLKKKEIQLRAKEELGEGLHLIDFEQLKIENQTYNEKIEERNEELMKLKRKINETVQILTHVKEKLKFVSAQNEREKEVLNEAEKTVKEVSLDYMISNKVRLTVLINFSL
jgi:CII-binding regulator of phage lambda lysogenization HflD